MTSALVMTEDPAMTGEWIIPGFFSAGKWTSAGEWNAGKTMKHGKGGYGFPGSTVRISGFR
jgi:hypothetical protein